MNASPPPTAGPASSGYDVVFVGAGISNTFTLVELLGGLEERNARAARILIIDRDPEFFTGVPYGRRSGDLGLIISRLADFLPAAHVVPFGEWLAGNRDRAFERFFALGGEGVREWRERYWPDVEAGSIGELYLPRYVFGLYVEQLALGAIERAQERGVATCDTAVGEVIDVERSGDGLTVVARDAGGRETRSRSSHVVLGLGGAPSKRILRAWEEASAQPGRYALIEDPFEPGIADMLERIRTTARSAEGRGRVLIVGSNAGALDVIFNLMNDPAIAAAVDRIDVVSTSGRFPELFRTPQAAARGSYATPALAELATRPTILADDIFEAVRSDLDGAHRAGLTITDTFWDISAGFNSLLNRLSPEQMLRFACETGPRIGTLRRRVGHDYWAVIEGLTKTGRLSVSSGRFPAVSVAEPESDLLAVINCAGSERLSSEQLHSGLIRALIAGETLRPTGSDAGIRVDDDLQTDTPGLYVIGPMLSGNVVRGGPEWNLEHCGRIAMFARQLGGHLADRLSAVVPA